MVERGDGHEGGDEALERGVQQAVQLVEFALGVELGEKRERGHADALSDDAERHAHERLGITQPGNGGGLEVGAEPADDPVVGEGERQAPA